MQILLRTKSSTAGCALDSCYYIPYQKPLVYNAYGDAAAAREDCHPTTIVADLRPFSAMENGEACPESQPTLQETLGALLYTHVYWQWTMENGEWSSKIGRVPSPRGAEA